MPSVLIFRIVRGRLLLPGYAPNIQRKVYLKSIFQSIGFRFDVSDNARINEEDPVVTRGPLFWKEKNDMSVVKQPVENVVKAVPGITFGFRLRRFRLGLTLIRLRCEV